MGLPAQIYKHNGQSYSNGGLSERVDEVTIVNIDGPFEPTDKAPAVLLVRGNLPNTAKIVPASKLGETWFQLCPEKLVGPMSGGTFVSTSDSRLSEAVRKLTGSYSSIVPLHDRFETVELYNTLSR